MEEKDASPVANGPRALRRPVEGALVQVMEHRIENRGMFLEDVPSRALCRYEIHELLTTTDSDLQQGSTLQDASFIGFFEVLVGGMARLGDSVEVDGLAIGTVAGFDFCHMPNHLNVIVAIEPSFPSSVTGRELGLRVGGAVQIGPRRDS